MFSLKKKLPRVELVEGIFDWKLFCYHNVLKNVKVRIDFLNLECFGCSLDLMVHVLSCLLLNSHQ